MPYVVDIVFIVECFVPTSSSLFLEPSILIFLTKDHGTFSLTWLTIQPNKKEKSIGAKGKKRNPSQLCPTYGVVWCDVCPVTSPCRWHSRLGKERKEKSVLFLSIHGLSSCHPRLLYFFLMKTYNCWDLRFGGGCLLLSLASTGNTGIGQSLFCTQYVIWRVA